MSTTYWTCVVFFIRACITIATIDWVGAKQVLDGGGRKGVRQSRTWHKYILMYLIEKMDISDQGGRWHVLYLLEMRHTHTQFYVYIYIRRTWKYCVITVRLKGLYLAYSMFFFHWYLVGMSVRFLLLINALGIPLVGMEFHDGCCAKSQY